MITFAATSFPPLFRDKVDYSGHAPVLVMAVVTETLLAAAAACFFFKGVGVFTSASLLAGAAIPEGLAAGTILLSLKPAPKAQAQCRLSINSLAEIVPTEEKPKTKILIKDAQEQIQRYERLLPTTAYAQCDVRCDRYSDTLPTVESRIFVNHGVATNGAEIWEGDILMQGPEKLRHKELLWRVVAEKNVQAILRIGKDNLKEGCCSPYTPKQEETVKFGEISISSKQKENLVISETITCEKLELHFDGKEREVCLFAFEGWPDHDVSKLEEVYALILALEKIKGPILVHCRGGVGRSGTFVVCRSIYKQLQKAKAEGRSVLEIDPAQMVENLRSFRQKAVEQKCQFEMIISFIEFLNGKEN